YPASPSVPTRRSSDLLLLLRGNRPLLRHKTGTRQQSTQTLHQAALHLNVHITDQTVAILLNNLISSFLANLGKHIRADLPCQMRAEEHTSELQSRENL